MASPRRRKSLVAPWFESGSEANRQGIKSSRNGQYSCWVGRYSSLCRPGAARKPAELMRAERSFLAASRSRAADSPFFSIVKERFVRVGNSLPPCDQRFRVGARQR